MKATKVTLREKPIAAGRKSLYLDFYPAILNTETRKETRREFLGLYILERPRTESEKRNNKETKALAESIRSKRQLAIQAGDFGFLETQKRDADFLLFFRSCLQKRHGSTQCNWESAYKHLEEFTDGKCLMSDISEAFMEEFKIFLLQQDLAVNSCVSYFNKLRVAIKEAFLQHYLSENPALRVKAIKPQETQREFLTLEELQLLAQTVCTPSVLKQAALFSVLTGLRWSDIQHLRWGQIQYTANQGYFIRFTQQKTQAVETLPISAQAASILGERQSDNELVLPNMKYSAWTNIKIKQWVLNAGITKNISFHCFRHTFATLQLASGTDIFTVSKMLGHKDLKTTQIYAKVIDQKKVEAANKIKLEL